MKSKTQMQGSEQLQSNARPRNGIFIKLAVVGLCLSVASSASYWLSFLGGRFAHYEGSPSDEAILYSFLYGLVLSQVITIFLPKGYMLELFTIHFVKVVLRSLVFVVPCWLLLALAGSMVVGEIVSRSNAIREEEWYQISLVLLSASATLMIWHWLYHSTPRKLLDTHTCPSCGYDLTGNESGECPECGAEGEQNSNSTGPGAPGTKIE